MTWRQFNLALQTIATPFESQSPSGFFRLCEFLLVPRRADPVGMEVISHWETLRVQGWEKKCSWSFDAWMLPARSSHREGSGSECQRTRCRSSAVELERRTDVRARRLWAPEEGGRKSHCDTGPTGDSYRAKDSMEVPQLPGTNRSSL